MRNVHPVMLVDIRLWRINRRQTRRATLIRVGVLEFSQVCRAMGTGTDYSNRRIFA